ncbi:hypothetical protein LBMAG42_32200 [Deltaproteobacteria bacterium]|nr:hypothetical protein LBMAG42_32200 [Deltaproteobacteria bacterium]
MERWGAAPAEGILHPAALSALLVMVVNDHWAKAAHPGLVTGKLSDFAGVCFFPFLLVAIAELAGLRGRERLSRAAGLATAFVFVLVETSTLAGNAYAWGVGAMQWPVWALLSGVRGETSPVWGAVPHVVDAADLIALPMAGVAWGVARVAHNRERR